MIYRQYWSPCTCLTLKYIWLSYSYISWSILFLKLARLLGLSLLFLALITLGCSNLFSHPRWSLVQDGTIQQRRARGLACTLSLFPLRLIWPWLLVLLIWAIFGAWRLRSACVLWTGHYWVTTGVLQALLGAASLSVTLSKTSLLLILKWIKVFLWELQ